MLELITGGFGTGKSYEMMSRISEAVSKEKLVYAIVPDQFNFEYNRMLYNFMGMEKFNRMEVLSFSRLAKYIFIKHGGLKGKYADDTVRNIVMFRALSKLNSDRSLGFYSRQARLPKFLNDALEFVRTLSSNSIAPIRFSECVPFMDEKVREKASDISLIYSEYSRLLEESGYKDSRTDITEAAKKAAAHNFFDGMEFYIDEFKSFTPDEYEMLSAMICGKANVTVCLTTEDEVPMHFSVFETANKTAAKLTQYAKDGGVEIKRTILKEKYRFKFPELEFASRNVLRAGHPVFDGKCENIKIYKASEPYGEADFVCAEIGRLVMEKGLRYSDITVISRCKENYSSIMDAAFERSDIPFYSDEKQNILHKSLIIFIRTALKLVSAKNIYTEDMLRYIKTGFTGLDPESTDILESYCYKWNVEGQMWLEPFVIWDKEKSDGDDLTADEIAERSRVFVITPLERLKKKCYGATAAKICTAVSEFLEETKVTEQISGLISNTKTTDSAVISALREAKQLWDMLCELLQTIYRTIGSEELTAAEFSSLFEAAASSLSLSAPPQTLDAVRFSSSNTARLANPKVIFVIGATEGVFPFAAKPSSILSDKDIEEMKSGGIEISGSSKDKLAEERFTACAALSGASERLYVTYPSANLSGGVLYPSSAVKQLASMFKDISTSAEKLGTLYFCTNEKNGQYHYIQSFKRRDGDISSLRAALERFDPENKKRFDYFDGLRVDPYHKLSTKNNIPERLFGKNITLSASRLEDYKKCPFVYFCKKGLNIYPRTKIQLDPSAHGTAVHYCLSEFLKAHDKRDFLEMTSESIFESVKAKLAEYYAGSEIGSGYGKTKRYKAAFDRLAETVFDILKSLQTEFKQSDFRPDNFEYTFSYEGNENPVRIKADDGSNIFFIGAVDRVDCCDKDGITYIRVVDYKTGDKQISLEDWYYGLNMQMLLYLFALTDPNVPVNQGLYHGAMPAGILYMHAKDLKPSLPRNADESKIEKARLVNGKMSGWLLADQDIVRAMEKEAAGVFVPVRIKNDGGFYASSPVITGEQFERLRKYSEEMIKKTAADIKEGKIEADPLIYKKSSPCSYCDYSSVCGNFPNINTRSTDILAKEKMIEIMGDQ